MNKHTVSAALAAVTLFAVAASAMAGNDASKQLHGRSGGSTTVQRTRDGKNTTFAKTAIKGNGKTVVVSRERSFGPRHRLSNRLHNGPSGRTVVIQRVRNDEDRDHRRIVVINSGRHLGWYKHHKHHRHRHHDD